MTVPRIRVEGRLAEEVGREASSHSQEPRIVIKRSCKYCSHLKVCAIFRAVDPLLKNWGEDRPFEAEEVANICGEYRAILGGDA